MTSTNNVHSIDDEDNHENADTNDDDDRLPPPTIGARVSAMYQGARRSGTVINVNDKRGIFKMRFDDFPTAEFDYSFSYKSSAWSYVTPPTLPQAAETTNNNDEPLFTISKKFKALIKV